MHITHFRAQYYSPSTNLSEIERDIILTLYSMQVFSCKRGRANYRFREMNRVSRPVNEASIFELIVFSSAGGDGTKLRKKPC